MNFSYYLDRYFIKKPRIRRFVTSLLEPDSDLDVSVAGAKLRINRRREQGYLRASRIVRHNATLRDEIPVLMNLFSVIRDGDTFVDVGANTGLFTHSMARLTEIYQNFNIVAIEANPDTFSRLSTRKIDRVSYINVAMSDKCGEMEFIRGAVSHVFTSIDRQNSYNIPGETVSIQTRTLDDLDLGNKSIVLKIDVEGQESRVLRGASGLFEAGLIRAVYLDGYDDPLITKFLSDLGFKLFEGRTLRPLQADEKSFSLLALRPCK